MSVVDVSTKTVFEAVCFCAPDRARWSNSIAFVVEHLSKHHKKRYEQQNGEHVRKGGKKKSLFYYFCVTQKINLFILETTLWSKDSVVPYRWVSFLLYHSKVGRDSVFQNQ